MKSNIVFKKTPLGQQTITQRSSTLNRNLRLVLILVDGHSDIDQLRLKALSFDNLEQKLEQLALEGYIQASNPEWQALAQPRTSLPKNTLQPSLETSPVKAKLIDAAIMVLGNDAHKVIKILHEAPDDYAELDKAIKRCKKLVDLTIDQTRAKELRNICSRIILDASELHR